MNERQARLVVAVALGGALLLTLGFIYVINCIAGWQSAALFWRCLGF